MQTKGSKFQDFIVPSRVCRGDQYYDGVQTNPWGNRPSNRLIPTFGGHLWLGQSGRESGRAEIKVRVLENYGIHGGAVEKE